MDEIKYKDIQRLKFHEQVEQDSVYEEEYGIPYKIITLQLRRGISVDWNQLTRKCTIDKFDKDSGKILFTYNVSSLEELEALIELIKK